MVQTSRESFFWIWILSLRIANHRGFLLLFFFNLSLCVCVCVFTRVCYSQTCQHLTCIISFSPSVKQWSIYFWLHWVLLAAYGPSPSVKQWFVYLWLHWVLLAAYGLSLIVVCGGCSLPSHCGGFSCGAQALECGLSSYGHGLSCSMVRGIFSHQGLNPCPQHWQADS